jgi:hypothetical protein
VTAYESTQEPMAGSAAGSLIRENHVSPAPAAQAQAAPATAPAGPAAAAPVRRPRPDPLAALRPLAIDVGIPVGTYYLLHGAFGLSVWLSLALSSVGPAVRAIGGLAAERKLNLLAVLILAVNLAGIVVSFLTGDPRAMIAKDSLVSSVIAFAILGSVVLRRPLMSAGLKPFMTRGMPARAAAWDRLSAGSSRFRRLEMLFSVTWGLALLAECVARLVGAYTLPVTTMIWLSTVLTMSAIGLGILVGGAAAGPMQKLIDAEAARSRPGDPPSGPADAPSGWASGRGTGEPARPSAASSASPSRPAGRSPLSR